MNAHPDREELNRRCDRSITRMTDDAFDAGFDRGAKRALFLLDDLAKRPLCDAEGALAAYFRANAWSARSHIANVRQSWAWEAPERQEEMLAFSRAANHRGVERR